jgi:hypothetical protein
MMGLSFIEGRKPPNPREGSFFFFGSMFNELHIHEESSNVVLSYRKNETSFTAIVELSFHDSFNKTWKKEWI